MLTFYLEVQYSQVKFFILLWFFVKEKNELLFGFKKTSLIIPFKQILYVKVTIAMEISLFIIPLPKAYNWDFILPMEVIEQFLVELELYSRYGIAELEAIFLYAFFIILIHTRRGTLFIIW